MTKYIKYGLLLDLVIISVVAYLFISKKEKHAANSHETFVYTCSMHPKIIRNQPGNCPICGMTLIKKMTNNHMEEDQNIDNVIKPTDNYIVGEFQTTTAVDSIISSDFTLPGMITYDPNSSANISAKVSGRIEKLYVNFKYQSIVKGQKLFDLYSPELLTEQQNFIYILSNDSENNTLVEAVKQKLLLYGMSKSQITSLAKTKTINPKITVFSPSNGIVVGNETMDGATGSSMQNNNISNTEKLGVKEGDYIEKGKIVFKIANTDKVWGVFNIPQGYSGLVKINQAINIKTELNNDREIKAQINFIETQMNPAEKTNRIRVYLNNNNRALPIGLRLQGTVNTSAIQGIWIKKEATVSTGNKNIVFIKQQNGFKATAVKTGLVIGDYIQIINGISTKDIIAKNAQYLIDSESFIKTE
mgnify:FL=1